MSYRLGVDVGGTFTDLLLLEPATGAFWRHKTPSTVGAGGGSIAYVPELTKALPVGPQSAGAVPGPVAYGKGGTLPTVTALRESCLAETGLAAPKQPAGVIYRERRSERGVGSRNDRIRQALLF